MDQFKQQQTHYCAVGGVHCPCCNPYHGKGRKKLNKMARKRLKNALYAELYSNHKDSHQLENADE